MKLIFTDCENVILKNTEVVFEYKNSIETISTDGEGIISLKGLPEKVEIACFINESDKYFFKFKEKGEENIKLELIKLDMLFVIIGNNQNSLSGLNIFFEYRGKKEEHTSDNTGQIILKNIPLNTKIKAYQIFKGKEYNAEHFQCVRDKAQYFFVGDFLFESSDMKFKLIDESGQVIRNADMRFKIDQDEFEAVTNANGNIIVKDIKIDTIVSCKQLMFGKSLPWHNVTCEKGIDEYIIHGEKIKDFAYNTSALDSIVRMKFRLVDSHSEPVPNAIIKLEYDEKIRNKYSNQNGEAMIDDIRLGSRIKAFVDIKGKKIESEYICQEDNELHEMVIDTSNKKVLLALLGAIVLIAIIILFSKIDFSKAEMAENEEIKIEKDTIIRNYKYFVKDEISGESVVNAKISLIFSDTVLSERIKGNDFVNFAALDSKSPQKVKINAVGYLPYNNDFVLDSINEILLNKDTLVYVDSKVENCGLFTKSEWNGTTIKNFKLNKSKGRLKIFYNMFAKPDKIEVYKGGVYDISDENLLFSSKVEVAGMNTILMDYQTADSTITVKISGIENNKGWIYKVFCQDVVYPINNATENNN
ncbi:MAG: hypothetical protein JXR51_16065 [Bacteroidales bacterium]|nr:hypothetical protein [Bacteroidales bacterium]MBN2758683.1 hypothetical protein [Bacteroidales bacterium]